MKIGVNGRVLSTKQPGGAGQATDSLLGEISTYEDVVVFGNPRKERRDKDIDYRQFYLPFNSQIFGFLWENSLLSFGVTESDVDLLFCPAANPPLTVKAGKPVVTWIHDIYRFKFGVSLGDKMLRKIRIPRAIQVSDRLVVPSKFTKEELLDEFDLDPGFISVVPNGIDEVFFRKEYGEELDLPGKYLLYVGGLKERKNVDTLVKTFKLLKEKYGIDHKMVIIGPEKRFFSSSKTDLEDQDIEIKGFVPKEQLKYAYDNADVFLFPSKYEGFGLAPIEAMACRTPVVASDRASMPEVLGDAASLVEPEAGEIASEVSKILDNPDLRDDMAEKGKRHAKKYRWENAAEEFREIFHDCVKK